MRTLICLMLTSLLLLGCSSTPPSSPRKAAKTSTAANPQLSPAQASDITIHALGLVGTPYRYGGNTPDSGFDCSGLIGYVYQSRARIQAPRTVAQLSGFGQAVAASELRSGDLVLFGSSQNATHAGIYVGAGRFVHAPSSGGTVRLDTLGSPYWSRQNARFRRP